MLRVSREQEVSEEKKNKEKKERKKCIKTPGTCPLIARLSIVTVTLFLTCNLGQGLSSPTTISPNLELEKGEERAIS